MRWLLSVQNNKYIVFILFLVGLTLRLWGIVQDLPYNYYGDESYLIYNSLKFGTGDLNPHWFIWPTLFQYILFSLFSVFYILGQFFGWFKNATDFLYLYLRDPSIFFLIGRTISAIFGTASIFLVYFLAKKVYNKNTGLISACLFTFLPLAVEYSHYAVVDTALVFMILLSFIFIIKIFLYGRFRDYLLSGFFSGLAIATKYPAGLLVLSIFLAHLFRYHKKIAFGDNFIRFSACPGLVSWQARVVRPACRQAGKYFTCAPQEHTFLYHKKEFLKSVFSQNLFLSFLFVFLGFFLACPFAIFDFSQFFSDTKGALLCAKIGWSGWEKTSPYIYHLSQNLKDAMGLPLLIFSLVSLAYLAKEREKISLILLCFPVTYFLFIGLDKNTYARFMLPILPFLAIFSSKFLLYLRGVLNKRYLKSDIFFYVFFVLLLFNPVYTSIKTDLNFSLPNTMTLAKDWIEKNIPSGSKILLNEPGPPLVQNPSQIRLEGELKPEEQLRYAYHKKRDFFYRVKEEVAAQQINYQLIYIAEPIGYLQDKSQYEEAMIRTQKAIEDYSTKYNFIIINESSIHKLLRYPEESIPQRYYKLRSFYEDILNNYQPIRVFLPKENTINGQVIKIYKTRKSLRD